MTDGINLVMDDDGFFREAPEPFTTIVIDTEESWDALQDVVNRGNLMNGRTVASEAQKSVLRLSRVLPVRWLISGQGRAKKTEV